MSSGFPNGFGIVRNLTTRVVESFWGNPQKITVQHLEFEWEIPNFFQDYVKSSVKEELTSPEFESFGAKWRIYLQKRNTRLESWELFIGTKEEGSSDLWVHYHLGTKTIDGTVLKSVSGKIYLGRLSLEEENFKFSLGQFLPTANSSPPQNTGKKLTLNKWDLLRDMKVIEDEDVLVVFCNFSQKERLCERIVVNATKRMDKSNGKNVFSQSMKDMFHKQFFSDLTVNVKGEEFISHKSVLGARSPVFLAMLQNDMSEKRNGLIEITDCEPDIFREFLVYLYSGDAEELSTKRICGVYRLADKYDVPQLKLDCVAVMLNGMNVDNFCEIISLAIMYDESELIESGTEFFLKKAKSILESVQWQAYLAENPTVANELFLKKVNDGDSKK